MMKVKKVIDFAENFPVDKEAYRLTEMEDGSFTFSWGAEYPFKDELPLSEVHEKGGGVLYFKDISFAKAYYEMFKSAVKEGIEPSEKNEM